MITKNMLKSDKGQVWYVDLIAAMVIFTAMALFFYQYMNNYSNDDTLALENVILDAKLISNSLRLPGYPLNWTIGSVERIGITNENSRLDVAKVRMLSNLSEDNYSLTKSRFGTPYDYAVYFEKKNGYLRRITGVYTLGSQNIDLTLNISSSTIAYYPGMSNGVLGDEINKTSNTTSVPVDNHNVTPLFAMFLESYEIGIAESPGFSPAELVLINSSVYQNGTTLFISNNITRVNGSALGVYNQHSAGIEKAVVVSEDKHFEFELGDTIECRSNSSVDNNVTGNATNFISIADFHDDGRPAIAKWTYGNGTVYYFCDFNSTYTGPLGNFTRTVGMGLEDFIFENFVEAKINNTPVDSENMIQVIRLVIHNTESLKMVVRTWD